MAEDRLPGRRPERTDDYAPIADYAVLGDGRTVALVAADGRIDWWPFPTLDAAPIFSAVLDPGTGGHLALAPEDGDARMQRRYVERTNVLETVWTTATGEVVVTDALAVGSAGRLPWTELARRVEGRRGRVRMRWELRPGDRFRSVEPWVHHRHGIPVVQMDDQKIGVVTEGLGEPQLEVSCISGVAEVSEGERGMLAVVGTVKEPLFVPSPDDIHRRLDATVGAWRRWCDELRLGTGWDEAVTRSALALKTLLTEASGAIAAAATTSLPEGIGGPKNWDYRYAWVRDSSFTLDTLINLSLHEEVHGAVSWLLEAIGRHGLHIFFTLDGSLPDGEVTLDAPGYLGSRPVRAGNSASGQTQLGVYGDLFDTVARYWAEGHQLDPDTAGLLASLADRCCDNWRHRDSGIWELPDLQHYTISKMGCWVALDRAVRLAEADELPQRHLERWRTVAGSIRDFVETECWSDRRQSYLAYAGGDSLDAAVLLAARTGFNRGPRLASTADAVAEELGRGPLLYRYSGVDKEEGAFVACSFWLVEALVHTGQLERARALMDELVARTSDVGLLAEQIDPVTGAFLGNIPQGLSHLALVNAAFTLCRATGG